MLVDSLELSVLFDWLTVDPLSAAPAIPACARADPPMGANTPVRADATSIARRKEVLVAMVPLVPQHSST